MDRAGNGPDFCIGSGANSNPGPNPDHNSSSGSGKFIYFRHDHVRPSQKELLGDIYDAIKCRKILLAHAKTGLGKTDSALSAAITCAQEVRDAAAEQDLTIFFLTPKISQHKIAVDVVRGLAEKHGLQKKLRVVDVIGRSHCCIDNGIRELDHDAFQTACVKRRKKHECIFYENARGNGIRGEAQAEIKFRQLLEGYGTGKAHDELLKLGARAGCCPYEWMLKLAEVSNVIVADYYHVMVPHIRDIFLLKVKKRIEDSIIIIDEAHNLASRIRDSLSSSINTGTFLRASKEMRFLGLDPGPAPDAFDNWAAKLIADERERLVSPYSFVDFFSGLGTQPEDVARSLGEAGVDFVERTGKKSACLKLAEFITTWDDREQECVRVLRRKGDWFFLSRRLLDPSPATRILNQCHAAVLMSGSLLPLEMHREVLGLDKERTIMRSYPSPFDPSNTINIITENLTTRYSKRDQENYSAIAAKINSIISSTPGGTAVFFPSYVVMDNVLPLMESGAALGPGVGLDNDSAGCAGSDLDSNSSVGLGGRPLLVQRNGMRPHEIRQLLREFRNHCNAETDSVLCGVQGGSLAEGVDYCDGEIKTVVIVGVALDEMDVETRAVIDYYDDKFGRGWDYGYLYPGTIKALQAAGRARRKESDRVAVVYMDERFKWGKYNWILDKKERFSVTTEPEKEVRKFWAVRIE